MFAVSAGDIVCGGYVFVFLQWYAFNLQSGAHVGGFSWPDLRLSIFLERLFGVFNYHPSLHVFCYPLSAFQRECCAKYGSEMYEKFLGCFSALPVCAILAQQGQEKRYRFHNCDCCWHKTTRRAKMLARSHAEPRLWHVPARSEGQPVCGARGLHASKWSICLLCRRSDFTLG